MSKEWRYVSGDWNIFCDVCSEKIKASTAKQRWDGLITCPNCWEMRHPQDFIRVRTDKISVPWSRHFGTGGTNSGTGTNAGTDGDSFTNVDYLDTDTCTPITRSAHVGFASVGCSHVGDNLPMLTIDGDSPEEDPGSAYSDEDYVFMSRPFTASANTNATTCVYAGDRYVIAGVSSSQAASWWSDDVGQTWTETSMGGNFPPTRLRYLEGCVVGCTGSGTIKYSLDNGQNWQATAATNASGWWGAASDGAGTIKVVSLGFNIVTSTDSGNTWGSSVGQSGSGSFATFVTDMAYGNGYWVITWSTGHISYSTNGTTWTTLSVSVSSGAASSVRPFGISSANGASKINSIIFDGTRFIIVGKNGNVAQATIPTTWSNMNNLGTQEIHRIAQGDGRYVVTTGNSTDGHLFWETNAFIAYEGNLLNFGPAGSGNYQIDVAFGETDNFIFVAEVTADSGVAIFGFDIPNTETIPLPDVSATCLVTSGVNAGSYVGACLAGAGPWHTDGFSEP